MSEDKVNLLKAYGAEVVITPTSVPPDSPESYNGVADRLAKALKVFSFAESLGAVESLVCHPATMTHASIPEPERERRGITEGTIRLSVGIEDVEDLIADLDQAIGAAIKE